MPEPGASPQPRRTRRTRFVCISDTHNCTVRLPKGDVLVHCGDLTNQGSFGELSKQVRWLEQADFECKIVVAGNHDLTLDTAFDSTTHGSHRHNQKTTTTQQQQQQVSEDCRALLTTSGSLTYLLHESRIIKLTSPSGPRTAFSVFGSPYSPARGGSWAFQYPEPDDDDDNNGGGNDDDNNNNTVTKSLWDEIPLDTDILITHGPARTHCDGSSSPTHTRTTAAAGSEMLRRAVRRVRPRLAVCGHVHEARGAERVRWALEGGPGRTAWRDPDPDGGKNSLVDLSAKGGRPLDNDGSREDRCDGLRGKPEAGGDEDEDEDEDEDGDGDGDANVVCPDSDPDSAPGGWAAPAGRLGRGETCFVNCAVQRAPAIRTPAGVRGN